MDRRGSDQPEKQGAHQEAEQVTQDRQLEDEKAGVHAEVGIGGAERGAVEVGQHVHARGRGRHAADHAEEGRGNQDRQEQVGAQDVAVAVKHRAGARPPVERTHPPRQPHVEADGAGHHREEDDEQHDPRHQLGGEHPGEAHRVEPELLRPQLGEDQEGNEQHPRHHQGGDEWTTAGQGVGHTDSCQTALGLSVKCTRQREGESGHQVIAAEQVLLVAADSGHSVLSTLAGHPDHDPQVESAGVLGDDQGSLLRIVG